MLLGRFRKSHWFWPVTIAVWAHLSLATYLLFQYIEIKHDTPGPKSALVDLTEARQNADGSAKVEPTTIQKQMAIGVEKASQMSDRQRETVLKENTLWLQKHSSPQAVDDINQLVQKSVGSPKRAYEPVTPPPPGAFDFDSMLPYESKKVTGKDGIKRSEQIWVDKDGRSLTQTYREVRDADGKVKQYRGMYQPDGSLFETQTGDGGDGGLNAVVQMMSNSPMLKKLFTGSVLPVLESQRDKPKFDAPKSPANSN